MIPKGTLGNKDIPDRMQDGLDWLAWIVAFLIDILYRLVDGSL